MACYCELACELPGFSFPRCGHTCARAPRHGGRCRCTFHEENPHRVEPLAVAAEGALDAIPREATTFAGLIKALRACGLEALIGDMRKAGILSCKTLFEKNESELVVLGVSSANREEMMRAVWPARALTGGGSGRKRCTSEGGPIVTAAAPLAKRGSVSGQAGASRPPAEVTIKPFRSDQPTLRPTARGSRQLALQATASEQSKQDALNELDRDILAASSKGGAASRWKTWSTFAREWGLPNLPLTLEVTRKVFASLKKGRYRHPQKYFAHARFRHVMTYQAEPSPDVLMAAKSFMRSVTRGMGPSALKDSFDVVVLADVAPEMVIQEAGDDVALCPLSMLVMGCWFMTRGIEAAAARAWHMELDNINEVVAWMLPSTKTDSSALGVRREHGCFCRESRMFYREKQLRNLCPYHCMVRYFELMRVTFGDDFNEPSKDFPLFPTKAGMPLSKAMTIMAIRSVLEAGNIELKRKMVDGSEWQRFHEHVLRVAGAQWLAACGIEVVRIQLLARWGSMAILRYIQEAPLLRQRSIASEVAGETLKDIHAKVARIRLEHADPETRVKTIQEETKERHGDIKEWFNIINQRLDQVDKKLEPEFMQSKLGKIHRILRADVREETSEWASWCGWRLGHTVHRRFSHAQVTAAMQPCSTCEKCFAMMAGTTGAGGDASDSSSDSSDSTCG